MLIVSEVCILGGSCLCCRITVTIKQPPLLNTHAQHFDEGNRPERLIDLIINRDYLENT